MTGSDSQRPASRAGLATDKRELWRELDPVEATANEPFTNFLVAEDGATYAYNFSRSLSELFVVEGVK